MFALDIFITWFLLSRDQWSETNRIYSSDCQQQADSCKVNDSVFSANQFWDRITSLTWKLTSSGVVWEIEWVRTSYFTNDRKLETNRGICIGHLLAQLANVSPGRLCRNSIWLNFIPKSYFRHRRDRIVTAVDTMCYIIEVHNIKLERDTLSKMWSTPFSFQIQN